MKKFICALWLVLCSNALSQETITHNISDDGFVEVPLQFVFPYYGQLFTNSWMFDNGVVGFYSPFNGYTGGQNFFSQPFSSNMGSQFNYMIAPLWTDLINYNGSFTTQGDSTFQRYNWNNISQWGYPENLNSFSLEITPSGSIDVQYGQINISGYPVSVGTTGDLSQGEFEQIFYADSGEPVSTNSIANWNTYTEADPCSADPLSSPQCPGYDTAYYEQQCSFDPLYDSQCTGYESAYLEQQCAADPLHSSQCPGYETAYFDQQCSIDPLYNSQCPGYEVAFVLSSGVLVANNEIFENIDTIEQDEVLFDSDTGSVEENEIATDDLIAEVSNPSIEQTTTENEVEEESDRPAVSSSLLRLVLSLVQDQQLLSVQNNTTASVGSNLTSSVDSEEASLEGNISQSIAIAEEESDQETQSTGQLLSENNISSAETSERLFNLIQLSQQTDMTTQAEIALVDSLDGDTTESDQIFLSEVNATAQESLNISSATTSSSVFTNNNMEQMLALGGSITQILNTTPNFSRFDIKPPSQEEQVVASRIENSLGNMSEEEIENQAETRIGSMDHAAQAIALQLIGYRPGFDQYGGIIVDQSNWYMDRGVYTNNRVPTSARSNLMFGAQDQRHQELMSLQYGR